VLNGDTALAEKSMRQHVRRSRDLVLRLPESMFAPERTQQ